MKIKTTAMGKIKHGKIKQWNRTKDVKIKQTTNKDNENNGNIKQWQWGT